MNSGAISEESHMTFLRRLLIICLLANGAAASVQAETIGADTATFDALLKRYVTASPDGVNRVDYSSWKNASADRQALNQVVDSAVRLKPSAMTKPQQLAYWANLYNAITLQVILDAYPVKSIRDIKSKGVWLDPKAFTGPWVQKRVTVEGRELSLDEIEHAILRPTFKDPRVHYAVNCASFGCPNLRATAWRAETLEADLDAAARDFVNHPRGASISGDGLKVSSIYKWFQVDFGGSSAGVIAHLKKYASPELAKKLDKQSAIADDGYDWSLNETSAAKAGAAR
jgi:Protein of unknown function, DUF547